tara:strand:- start:2816 stop:3790 length:975 start_codon:yes stop_codon:yes gene_type:complete
MNVNRSTILNDWIKQFYPNDYKIEPASSDASFRTYFKITSNNQSKIIMDAPPNHEQIKPFLDITYLLKEAGLNVPEIFEVNEEDGFILMSDLGKSLYLSQLNNETVYCLYTDAIDAIHKMQSNIDTTNLNIFNEGEYMFEMNLFKKWFLQEHLKLNINKNELMTIENCFKELVVLINKIPVSFTHRDFHSRNLLMTEKNNPGIIDYQDAVVGPITYDLVSLLKDCYISWDENLVYEIVKTSMPKITSNHNVDEFFFWFDITGVQRHLKAIGIFSRLYYRDNKKDFINDIPRTYSYIHNTINKYSELNEMKRCFNNIKLSEILNL